MSRFAVILFFFVILRLRTCSNMHYMSEFNCNDYLRETNERQSFCSRIFLRIPEIVFWFLGKTSSFPFTSGFTVLPLQLFNDAPCAKPQNLKPFLVLSKRYTIFNDRGSVGNVIASCKSCVYATTLK